MNLYLIEWSQWDNNKVIWEDRLAQKEREILPTYVLADSFEKARKLVKQTNAEFHEISGITVFQRNAVILQ